MKKIYKKILLTVCMMQFITVSFAQKENNVWAFGIHAGLDFNSGIPVPILTNLGGSNPSAATGSYEGCASVSDRYTGDLLFYTQGWAVWNSSHSIMPNGQNLSSHPNVKSTTQSSVIVPFPDNYNRYYLFSLGNTEVTPVRGLLSYSVIDMTLDGGRGDVVPGLKNIRIDSNLSEKIVAVGGENCNIWVLVHDLDDRFKAYEITAAGISSVPVISQVGSGDYLGGGEMKMSSDRKKIVCALPALPPRAELYDFDPLTGLVSNPLPLNFIYQDRGMYGTCFSPDNSKVYFQEDGWNNYPIRIYQYDLSSGIPSVIQNSHVVIDTMPLNPSSGGAMQLGPDGKVYAVNSNGTVGYIYSIDNPNVQGKGCNFRRTHISLLPSDNVVRYGLPNFVAFPPIQDTIYELTNVCEPADSLILRAPSGFYHYEWDDGSNDTIRVIRGTGKWWVRSFNYCRLQVDTFASAANMLTVDLGPDIIACDGDVIRLQSAGHHTVPAYQWSTGESSSSIEVAGPGDYWLHITENACTGRDTVKVDFISVGVNMGSDTGICRGDTLVLSVPYSADWRYLWSTGITDTQIRVTVAGNYWLQVENGGCVANDTIQIAVSLRPVVNLGADTVICEDVPVVLGTFFPEATYMWNTGSTDSFISVNVTGEYRLRVNIAGCVEEGTIHIVAMPSPLPDLGPDRYICTNDTLLLNAGISGNNRYLWNTGDTGAVYAATAAGTYSVSVTTEHRCTGSDTVLLTFHPKPVVSLGPDTTVCEETPLLLVARKFNADSLVWSDGSTGEILSVQYGGTYTVTGINRCGTGADTILVRQLFCDIWLPNAFTPNNDGVNDVFRVLGNTGRLEGFALSIYDRWGQRVFHTADKYKGWDGMFNGGYAQLGTYVYQLQYNIDRKPYLQKGNFHLLR